MTTDNSFTRPAVAWSLSGKRLIVRGSLVLMLASFCFSGLAQAQEKVRLKDVNERLQRVERVLDQSLLELLQQVESLKREIRSLRGELENQAYELGNLKKRNRDLYLDTDQRLTEIEDQSRQQLQLQQDSSGDGLPLLPDATGDVIDSTSGSLVDDSPIAVVSAESAPALGAASESAQTQTSASSSEEKAAYTKAYNLLATGSKAQAVQGFDDFLAKFPNGSYADNAHYWQGEARYAQREFDAAIAHFINVIKTFPNSPKVPDARLKIAYALYEQKRFPESRDALLGITTDHPGRPAARLARKRLQEMDERGL